ncbi:ABC transporter permease (plasmid) [Azospirillum argentinense]|uniref:Transport permease protein n=1 Tax=Azospirillum argentinense TaxID=2970906 RepID=A0A4D8PR38_9PROT|nr:ABC transporter permease [Azospirillum argentinense]QCO00413.1 ABC transporter permease [Azospirillum argentinense]
MAAPLACIWQHRRLILRLAQRDLEARYRGSMLGLIWAVLTPLLMMGVYTFVFTVVFQARWGTSTGSKAEFAVMLFSGLVLFSIFSESLARAPGLMLENVSYIKKVVFPLEILPAVILLVALANAGISFLILEAFAIAVFGFPPLTILLFPLILLPLCLFTLGITWFLSSLGVFLRDIKQMVSVLVTVLMFVSPIFYPVSAIPEVYRPIIQLNPLTRLLEGARDVLFWGTLPNPLGWLLSTVIAYGVAWLGYVWFMKTRKAFADVV